jgi:hypothetical protein
MPRGSNPIKVQQWKERLERFARSGLTVVQFCQAERVSQPSFYQWKKKLAGQASPASSHSKAARFAFRAVEVTSPSQAATTIRLGNGIEIELGGDLRVVQAVVKQLLELPATATLAAGGRSC